MEWKWIRLILAVLGVMYVWSLLPVGIRPQLADSPLRKSEQTVTVQVDNRAGKLGTEAAGKIRTACKPPFWAQMFMAPANSARLLLKFNDTTVGTREVLCRDYVKKT